MGFGSGFELGACGGGGGGESSLTAEILADSPVGFWKLNDPAGNFVDSSGNGFDLTPSGTIVRGVDGPLSGSKAAQFDAGSTAVRTPAISDLTSGITIEGWIFITDDTVMNLIVQNMGAGNGYGIYIGAEPKVHIIMQGVVDVAGRFLVPVGQWNYVSAVRDSAIWTIYLNGNIDSQPSTAVPFAPSTGTGVANTQTADGTRLAYCALYNTALSTERIVAHATATLP